MLRFKFKYCLYLILIIIVFAFPVSAKIVKVTAEKMQYLQAEDRLDAYGNAKVITDDVIITADMIQAVFTNGEVVEVKALGEVTIERDGNVYNGRELTYNIKDEQGIILDIELQTELEDSKEIAFLSGKEASYTNDLIDILDGHFTACDLEHPHYLFKAKRIKIYPDDKIQAYHVTFWELNGKIPLFYWPYYTKSLKDKKNKFTPSVGYSASAGWFIKTVYAFFLEGRDDHGELYLDYFQNYGFAGGAKYYYMDKEKQQGYVYLYLQQTDNNPGQPYLRFDHNQTYSVNDWSLKTSTSYYRYDLKSLLSNSSKISYKKQANTFDWAITYNGSNNTATDSKTYYLKNDLGSKFKIGGVTLSADFEDNRYFDKPDSNYWNGELKLNQNVGILNWTLLMKKDGKSNDTLTKYYLPELTTKLTFSRIKDRTVRSYVSPFTYTMIAGHYIENRSEINAYKLSNNLQFSKTFKLPLDFKLTATTSGKVNLYSTADYNYSYDPSLSLKYDSRWGLSSGLDYKYRNGDGDSPFVFDRSSFTESHTLRGNLAYSKFGFTLSTFTTYDFIREQFQSLTNKFEYKKDTNTMTVSFPYDLKNKQFSTITAKANLKYTDFNLVLESVFEPKDLKFKLLSSDLKWKINEDWNLTSVIQFDPSATGSILEDRKTRATMSITRTLHCREISMSYDFVQREIWFAYNLLAFPNEKVKVGSSPEEPIQFDLNLGGMSIGK